MATLLDRTRDGDSIIRHETLLPSGPETSRQVAVSLAPVRDLDARVAGIAMTVRDITDLKRAEEQRKYLEELENTLQQRQMSESLTVMAASIAHEVKQPVASMVTNAGAASRWLAKGEIEEARAALTNIVSAGHRASELIETIRGMFKKDVHTKASLNVNVVVQDVAALVFSELTRQQISVKSELAENLPQIFADRVQMQQVILNLVINAIDAMALVTDRARVLRLRSEPHNADGVLIAVEDSGMGIDSEKIERIFEAFYTTKANGMGMGWQFAARLLKLIAAASGRRRAVLMERLFTFNFRAAPLMASDEHVTAPSDGPSL